jgi:hypothetical protein
MIRPWELLDAGLWLVFLVWSIALNLCRDHEVGSSD